MTAISTIRNLGPAMETALIDAGIADAETLREVGADAAYCKLLENGQRPISLNIT
jgi:DNA transformation protein